jgi:CheY-like chemotaxis protein
MKRVLLVEDTLSLAENITEILSNLGFKVTTVSNGKEAIDLLTTAKPDLIITDVQMPLMDGLELIRNIRQNPTVNNLPVIILSARATPEDIKKGFEAGANEYLKKPCAIEDLIDAIERCLSQ